MNQVHLPVLTSEVKTNPFAHGRLSSVIDVTRSFRQLCLLAILKCCRLLETTQRSLRLKLRHTVCFLCWTRTRPRTGIQPAGDPPHPQTLKPAQTGVRVTGRGVSGQGLEGLWRMPCRSSGKERMTASMWDLSLATVPGRTGSCSFSA